jgi:hypothetical protein
MKTKTFRRIGRILALSMVLVGGMPVSFFGLHQGAMGTGPLAPGFAATALAGGADALPGPGHGQGPEDGEDQGGRRDDRGLSFHGVAPFPGFDQRPVSTRIAVSCRLSETQAKGQGDRVAPPERIASAKVARHHPGV